MPRVTHSYEKTSGGYHTGHARLEGGRESLQVHHSPGSGLATHEITIQHADGTFGRVAWPSYNHPDKAAVSVPGQRIQYLAPPNEALRSLIESHHETGAWMPLLDELESNYPELGPSVARHTRERAT